MDGKLHASNAPWSWNDPNDDPNSKLPTASSLIGITVAVTGNVLISLALNCQKLAHQRLERQRNRTGERSGRSATQHGATRDRTNNDNGAGQDAPRPHVKDRTRVILLETTPLLVVRDRDYGIEAESEGQNTLPRPKRPGFTARLFPKRFKGTHSNEIGVIEETINTEPDDARILIPVNDDDTDHPTNDLGDRDDSEQRPKSNGMYAEGQSGNEGNESDYLKSKLWWLGFLLMNVGELGNFISYGFAPASVVAPLGTFALIANCFFAPLMLGERFRKRDMFGILVAIVGAVTVVIASKQSDTRLDPAGLLRAITQTAFIVLSIIYAVGICILVGLSEGHLGREWVYVDVGACALFGGFTVLATKGISTMFTMTWWQMFTEWITYPILLVLISSGIGQIKYLNRALMKFDSKVVIPTQFVLFNLSAIVGSAVLYGDFRKATLHSMVTFLYGCAATFAGVFIITWTPPDTRAGPALDRRAESRDAVNEGLGDGERQVELTVPGPRQILRAKASSMSIVGLSPAQRVLLVHSPPRESLERTRSFSWDRERGSSPERRRDSYT
ncbi:DUF803-domain-containing protein [Rickenella mellea]|uniref:DUF803-domain-containing protein n=1 Tax=Rickenella mellea TaxID=50990 RepID=A0A4R5XFA9_9AGAM|nr:DUF803-domain-containing protein [Rickenella mellea]